MAAEYDDLVKALWTLDQSLDEIALNIVEMRERIHQIARAKHEGRSLNGMFGSGGPTLVKNLAEINTVLATSGSRVRRLMARALLAEGMAPSEIADLFGVSRQRISRLLRDD